MELLVVGLSHKAAPVEVRERLAFSPVQQESALAALRGRASEGVILSTCNRTEVYAVVPGAGHGEETVVAFLADYHALSRPEFAPYLYCREGEAAADHLFSVAAGLDSMILGEPQILGQVRAAYETAARSQAAGPVLSWVFHHALKVGKQVRSDTEISRSAVSVSYAAVELAREVFGTLAGRSVLVVGAGKMGELAARTLLDNGLTGVVVTNRTYSRAVDLAARFGGQAAELARLPELLAAADVVITSTGAPGFVLGEGLVRQAMRGRRNRPLLVVDIAVPRDVDPKVQQVDGVFLYDIDDLQAICAANLEERRKEAVRARRIVEAEVAAFRAWSANLAVVPTISALRRRAEEIRQAELRKHLGRMGELSERQRNTLDALTSAIVNKMLHQPITRLKASQSPTRAGADVDHVRSLRELFALDDALEPVALGPTREPAREPALDEETA